MINYNNMYFYSSGKFIFYLKYKENMNDEKIVETLSEYWDISIFEANRHMEYFNKKEEEEL